MPAPGTTFAPNLVTGFNLIGNSLNITLNVATVFGNQDAPVTGVTSNILTIWKWNAATARWSFYSPQLTVAANTSHVAANGYDLLASIEPGRGYWVNSKTPMVLPGQTGANFSYDKTSFAPLVTGFNLIATTGDLTPSAFNILVNPTTPAAGVVPAANFSTLWAWDATALTWYFYAPTLERDGGLAAVQAYATAHSFRHFQDFTKTLGTGTGFWVNRLAP